MAEKLKICSLGGLGEIGKNMTLFEFRGDMIVIDCGMGFPDEEMYGIDVVIPDVTYLVKNVQKLRGILITHGHEDHIGALPYVLQQVNVPVYATRMSMALIRHKLEEHGMAKKVKLIEIADGDVISLGKSFEAEAIRVNHSIANSVAYCITTPLGKVVITGDFKIDTTPVAGKMINLTRFGQLGEEGILALLADSTNVERPGWSISESAVGARLDSLFENCSKRIIVTTFASNIFRIEEIILAAAKHGRKVGVTGRSMETIMRACKELGYITIADGVLVDMAKIGSFPPEKVAVICTGSQGENMSALYRMAFGAHRQVQINSQDRVIISASAIPGNEKTVTKVINELFRKGAEVLYKDMDDIHASGHACREELKLMHALIKPKYFIPIHGEYRHLKIHSELAQQMGMDAKDIVVADIGRVIEIDKRKISLGNTIPSGRVMVDGAGIGDVGAVVLRDRKHLAQDGMLVVVLSLSAEDGSLVSGPDIITRGFVYVKESEKLMDELRRVVLEAIDSCARRNVTDWASIKGAVKSDLSDYLFKTTKRNPMILPIIMEI